MEILSGGGKYAEADVQALAVAIFKDEKVEDELLKSLDELTGGVITSVLETGELKGKEGETVYIHLANDKMKAKRLLLVGVGTRDDYKVGQSLQFSGTAVRFLRSKNIKTIGIVPRSSKENLEKVIAAVAEGAVISLFDPDKYRTVEKEDRQVEKVVVIIPGTSDEAVNPNINKGRIIGESVNFTRELANEPGSFLTPTIMAERAQTMAKEFGLEINVLDQSQIEQEGMGAWLGVAKGSDEPAK
jgi:leucyl aminopeptidase